jgi:hypothetical protein
LKSVLFKIIGVILGLLVALVIAEVAVRLISPQEVGPVRFACDPRLGTIPVPGQKGRRDLPGVFHFTYSNNSLGWRGSREYRVGAHRNCRVLFLGDSFTYGIGVNDNQTFAARVEKLLRAEIPGLEVMNAGCPGKGTDYALKCFQTVGRTFHPNLTVLCFFCNDFQDNARGEYYNVGQGGVLTPKAIKCGGGVKNLLNHLPGYNWLISWSQAANLIKQAGVNFLVNRAKKHPGAGAGEVVTYQPGLHGYADRRNQALTGIYLKNLAARVKQDGGELIMFYIPISQEVIDYRRTQALSTDELALQRLAADNHIMLWSLTPLLAHSGQPIDRLYYKEGHWTAAAHELAARFMSREIDNRLGSCRRLHHEQRIFTGQPPEG